MGEGGDMLEIVYEKAGLEVHSYYLNGPSKLHSLALLTLCNFISYVLTAIYSCKYLKTSYWGWEEVEDGRGGNKW